MKFTFFLILFLALLTSANIYFDDSVNVRDVPDVAQREAAPRKDVLKNDIKEAGEKEQLVVPEASPADGKVSAPPPLKALRQAPTQSSALTADGIILWTNYYRLQNNLPTLKKRQELSVAATEKVRDMFEKQYFAHDGPDGRGAADFAREAGYDFIAVGENLALGNFKDDKALVDAWMESPGHRANILESTFTEIGVSAEKGVFEGAQTSLAVQEFGLPRSACPSVDFSLKDEIDRNNLRLDALAEEIKMKKEELENTTPQYGSEYNRKVEEHNALVDDYNALLEETKGVIALYNSEVTAYNTCAAR